MELLLQILQAIVLLLTGFYVAMLIGDKRKERTLLDLEGDPERYLDVSPSSFTYGEK